MVKLYGIKNCDTVKKAQKWLQGHYITYEFHDYRSDGLTLAQLQEFAARLSWATMLNRNSTSWRQLEDGRKTGLDADKALQLMLDMPTLIKRPILAADNQYIIGFNADRYAALFNTSALS